ncbi:MAG: aminopeptidase N C-terminal domain-containing protein, partial [Gammaproteobacteria bacterium]
NPNKVRSLIGAFVHGNPLHFHAADGSGYRFLAEQVLILDRINPQIAARLLRGMARWRRYGEAHQVAMREALEQVLQKEVSRDVYEVASRSLEVS